jgi:hypothetical protein
VALPWNPRTGAWRVHVDAEDGRVLSRQPAVWHAKRGKVFKTARPVVGTLEEVALDLPDGAGRLANPRFDVKSCVDKKRCETDGGASFHTCDYESLAAADGNGDFLFERPTADTAPDDPLAEVNAFYHMTRAEEAFRALGAPALTAVPMRVFTNLRVSEDEGTCEPDRPLVPYENAFFTSQFDDAGPAFAFGQGEEVDYAYDWPVVFHEYAHGVQFASYGQVFTYRLDQQGLNDEAGALGEGTADYFAAVFTGNVRLGEYALPADLVRDVTIPARCPDNVTGEVHEDGKIFASALWAARVALPENQRPQLDRALLAVYARTGDITSFEFYRRTIVEEMGNLAGSAAAAIVQQKLAANGLTDCRRVVDVDLGQRWPFLFAYSRGSTISPSRRRCSGASSCPRRPIASWSRRRATCRCASRRRRGWR